MTSPFKFKAPASVGESEFPPDLTLDQLESDWSKSRLHLKEFLNKINDKYLNLEVYKQPLAGRLTLDGMLHFFVLHQQRHIKKIARHVPLN